MSTTTISPADQFAGFGGTTEEVDTRTMNIPAAVLAAMDNAVVHFSNRQNKKQLRTTFSSEGSAELFALQLSRYAAANKLTLSTLEQDGPVVRFRFAKVRMNGEDELSVVDPDDPEDDDSVDAE